ncbi:hypothetical protein ACOMHN_031004 [Nucella lapillus]
MFCGCVGCGEDGASSNLPLVIVMHVPAVLSLLCVANKTLSAWRLRLSGDIEEHPGRDLDPKQAKNDRGRERNESQTVSTQGDTGILLHVKTQGDTGILLHVSTQSDTRSKQADPVTRRTVPVVAVVSSMRHVRERTNHSTVAVTGDGGASPVTQASL